MNLKYHIIKGVVEKSAIVDVLGDGELYTTNATECANNVTKMWSPKKLDPYNFCIEYGKLLTEHESNILRRIDLWITPCYVKFTSWSSNIDAQSLFFLYGYCVDSGVWSSLDPFCKHQITYCNINLNMPSAPSYMKRVWHYIVLTHNLSEELYRSSHGMNTWITLTPTGRLCFFNNTIVNLLSNFIPSDYIKIQPKDPHG